MVLSTQGHGCLSVTKGHKSKGPVRLRYVDINNFSKLAEIVTEVVNTKVLRDPANKNLATDWLVALLIKKTTNLLI